MHDIFAIDGVFSPLKDGMIPASDRGFLFGDAVFETILGFKGVPIAVKPHLERLKNNAHNIGLHVPVSDEILLFEINHGLSLMKGCEKVSVRLVISRGDGFSLDPTSSLKPRRMLYFLKAPEVPTSKMEEGFKLLKKRLPYTERGASLKTPNYLKSVVAIAQAKEQGFDDVLWENSDGEITEASTSNVFFVGREGNEGIIHTPSLYSGLLPGITRSHILDLFSKAGILCEEVSVYGDDLARYDECFLSSSVRGLVPVSYVSRQKFHTTREGSLFWVISSLYSNFVN